MTISTEKWDDLSASIPDITRENLGDPNVGLTPAELGKEMIKPLISKANDEVKDQIKEAVEKEVKEKYGDEIDEAKEKLKNLF